MVFSKVTRQKVKDTRAPFQEVSRGQTFSNDSNVYIRTDTIYNWNACNLMTGKPAHFDSHEKVSPVAVLIIEEDKK